jgi:hypothetical protein
MSALTGLGEPADLRESRGRLRILADDRATTPVDVMALVLSGAISSAGRSFAVHLYRT